MSIYAVNEDGDGACVEVLYRVAGRGTGLMAQLKEGEKVGVVGPLGKGVYSFAVTKTSRPSSRGEWAWHR